MSWTRKTPTQEAGWGGIDAGLIDSWTCDTTDFTVDINRKYHCDGSIRNEPDWSGVGPAEDSGWTPITP
jgi:hypothetical protein